MMSATKLARNREIRKLRRSGMTLHAIARRYSLTHGRIGQITKGISPPERPAALMPAEEFRQQFHVRAKRWLWAAGYEKCSACKLWFSEVSYRRCGACAVSQQEKLRSTAEGRRKSLARATLQNNIVAGKVRRQPCEVCGEIKAQGHHDDYSKPLDVRWLCRAHHHAWHVEARKASTWTPAQSATEAHRAG